MGEESARKPEQLTRPNQGSTDPAGTGNRPERPAGNPRPRTAPAADTRTTGKPAAGAAGTGTPEKEKKPAELAVLKPDPAAPPAPETPKKQTRRKSTPKKKKDDGAFSSEQLTALLVSLSSIAASRPNMEVWALSPVEAQQIAEPLANILAKNEKLQNAGEYADAIALVTACLVVFIPRFLMYSDQMKQKKLEANGGVKLVRKESKNNGDIGKPVKPHADQPKNDANSIFAAIPPSI